MGTTMQVITKKPGTESYASFYQINASGESISPDTAKDVLYFKGTNGIVFAVDKETKSVIGTLQEVNGSKVLIQFRQVLEADIPESAALGEPYLVTTEKGNVQLYVGQGEGKPLKLISANGSGTIEGSGIRIIQVVEQNGVAGQEIKVKIPLTEDFKVLPVEVLQVTGEAKTDTIDLIQFNPEDASRTNADTSVVQFANGKMSLISTTTTPMQGSAIDTGIVYSLPLNKGKWKHIEKIEIV